MADSTVSVRPFGIVASGEVGLVTLTPTLSAGHSPARAGPASAVQATSKASREKIVMGGLLLVRRVRRDRGVAGDDAETGSKRKMPIGFGFDARRLCCNNSRPRHRPIGGAQELDQGGSRKRSLAPRHAVERDIAPRRQSFHGELG